MIARKRVSPIMHSQTGVWEREVSLVLMMISDDIKRNAPMPESRDGSGMCLSRYKTVFLIRGDATSQLQRIVSVSQYQPLGINLILNF